MKYLTRTLLALCPIALYANPQNGCVIEGLAKFDGINSSEMTIHTSDHAIIHWDSFSIGPAETTRFIQGSETASVLNRVIGIEPSQLLGQLLSDGNVYLVNPSGVIIGKNGCIDVGSFIASSFDIPNSAFLAGEDLFFEGTSLASLVNEGTIRAKNGDIFLFAHHVENHGNLIAKEGSVLIGAGHEILLGMKGKNLYVRLPGGGIENEGSIEAVKTILEANSNPYALGIQNSGRIDALQLSNENGKIFLRCKGSSLENHGTITAKEGSIAIGVFSDSLALVDQKLFINLGTIDAGAGTISINTPKYLNSGTIAAEGGSLSIFAPACYIETVNSLLSANDVQILAGNYFSSGKVSAPGGAIAIEGERINAAGARFDAEHIKVVSTSTNVPMYLNSYVILEGGQVELHSPLPVNSNAQLKGKVSVSSSFSPYQESKAVLVDPNPNTISQLWTAIAASRQEVLDLNELGSIQLTSCSDGATCPTSGIEYVDPNVNPPMAPVIGDLIEILSSGNVVVVKYNDDLNGSMGELPFFTMHAREL